VGRLIADDSSSAVTSFDVFKLQFYTQMSCAQPTNPSDFVYSSRIFVNAPPSDPTATLDWPVDPEGRQSANMELSGNIFQYVGHFSSACALNAAFPQGDYNFSLSSSSLSPTNQFGTLNLPSSFYSCSVPYFTNYSSLQNLDPSQNATFTWNSFTTNSSADLSQIFLVVRDNTLGMNVINRFISESGTTSSDITGGTLVGGHDYSATIYFSSRDTFSESEAWNDGLAGGLVAFDRATTMNFTAIPEPSTSALIAGGVFGLVAVGRRVGGRRRGRSPKIEG
jgi:hypothetical protein